MKINLLMMKMDIFVHSGFKASVSILMAVYCKIRLQNSWQVESLSAKQSNWPTEKEFSQLATDTGFHNIISLSQRLNSSEIIVCFSHQKKTQSDRTTHMPVSAELKRTKQIMHTGDQLTGQKSAYSRSRVKFCRKICFFTKTTKNTNFHSKYILFKRSNCTSATFLLKKCWK